MNKNQNAVSLLAEIMQERNWHQGKMPPTVASSYKALLKKGKVSYQKASEILVLLGWEKITEETWTNRN